jgi:3-hydroxyisobutyrate dehydrogenase
MRVAFIGLGNMGGGMAANLVKAGHRVRAFDLSSDALAHARDQGVEACAATREAVDGADAVVTMLPNGAVVERVYVGEVIGRAPASAVLIDCSTIAVADARRIEDAAAAAGYTMVDAPVSGGIAAAASGSLTFMVGGSEAVFARARPILEAMGKAVIHAGGPGAGAAAKICNNMLLGASMIATCEALRLADQLGLDAEVFYEIAGKSSGQCWSLTTYCPVPGVGPETPADHDYRGGFATALMLKDLKLAMEAAAEAGAQVPMGGLAARLYEAFAAAGNGALDFSAIIKSL